MSNNVETKSVCSSSSRPQVVAHLRNVVPMIATKKKESGIQSPRCVVATSKQVASNKPASAVDSPSLQKAVVQGVHRAGDKSTAVASTSPQGKSSSSRQQFVRKNSESKRSGVSAGRSTSSSVASPSRPVVPGYQKKNPDYAPVGANAPIVVTTGSSWSTPASLLSTKGNLPFLTLSSSATSTFPMWQQDAKDEVGNQAFQRGQAFYNGGNFEKAIAEFQKAISIRESAHGRYHPDTQRAYSALAGCYSSQKDHIKHLATCAIESRIGLLLDDSVTRKGAHTTKNLAVALEMVRQIPDKERLRRSNGSDCQSTASVASLDTVSGDDDGDDLITAVSILSASTSPIKLLDTEAECCDALKESIRLEIRGDDSRAIGAYPHASQYYKEAIEIELKVFGAENAAYAYLCRKRLCISLVLAAASTRQSCDVNWSKVDLMHATAAPWWIKSLVGQQEDKPSGSITAVYTIDPQVCQILAEGDELSSACHYHRAAEEYQRAKNLVDSQSEQQLRGIGSSDVTSLQYLDHAKVADDIGRAQQKYNDELLREVRATTDELQQRLDAEHAKFLSSLRALHDERMRSQESSWTQLLQSEIQKQHDAFAKDQEVLSQAKHERLIREVRSTTEVLDKKLTKQCEEQMKSTSESLETQLKTEESMLRDLFRDLTSLWHEEQTRVHEALFKSQSERLLEQVMATTYGLETRITTKQNSSLQSLMVSQQTQFDQQHSRLKEALDAIVAAAISEHTQAQASMLEAQQKLIINDLTAALDMKLDTQDGKQSQSLMDFQQTLLVEIGRSLSEASTLQQQHMQSKMLEELRDLLRNLQESMHRRSTALEAKLLSEQSKGFESHQLMLSDVQTDIRYINTTVGDVHVRNNMVDETSLRSHLDDLRCEIISNVKETSHLISSRQENAMQSFSVSQEQKLDHQEAVLVKALTDLIAQQGKAQCEKILEIILAQHKDLETKIRELHEKGLQSIISDQSQLYLQHRDACLHSPVLREELASWHEHALETKASHESLIRHQHEELMLRITAKVDKLEASLADQVDHNFQLHVASQQKRVEDCLSLQSEDLSARLANVLHKHVAQPTHQLSQEAASRLRVVGLVENMIESSQTHRVQQQEHIDRLAEQVTTMLHKTEDLSTQLSIIANNQARIDSNLSKLTEMNYMRYEQLRIEETKQGKTNHTRLTFFYMILIAILVAAPMLHYSHPNLLHQILPFPSDFSEVQMDDL